MPLTLAGYEAWEVVTRGSAQLRVAPSGRVIGFDAPALLMMADQLGYGGIEFICLLTDAETGMLEGIRERQDDHT